MSNHVRSLDSTKKMSTPTLPVLSGPQEDEWTPRWRKWWGSKWRSINWLEHTWGYHLHLWISYEMEPVGNPPFMVETSLELIFSIHEAFQLGKWGYPKLAGWFIFQENPHLKWMMTRGTLIDGNPQMVGNSVSMAVWVSNSLFILEKNHL